MTRTRLCCRIPNLADEITLITASRFDAISSNMILRLGRLSLVVGAVIYHHPPVLLGVSAVELPNNTVEVTIKVGAVKLLSCNVFLIVSKMLQTFYMVGHN